MAHKPKVLVDFDGVIHRYSKGWSDGTCYDPPMDGAKESLEALESAGYEVVIFSTRERLQIVLWFQKHDFPERRVTNIKEPAVAFIDDRAIRFLNWGQAFSELIDRYPTPHSTIKRWE